MGFLPLLQLVVKVCIAVVQLFDVPSLPLDVGTKLLVSLLQRAAELLSGLQVLT